MHKMNLMETRKSDIERAFPKIDQAVLELETEAGTMVAHELASSSQWHKIPKEIVTDELLKLKTTEGTRVIEILAELGNLHLLNQTMLVKNCAQTHPITDRSILHHAAMNGQLHLFPPSCLSLELMLHKDKINGLTPLAIACKHGHPNQVPQNLLTVENLNTQCGRTNAYKQAAKFNNFDKIPKELINETILLDHIGDGSTVIHWLAFNGQLNQIEEAYINIENLTREDKGETTALSMAVFGGNLHLTPKNLITEGILMGAPINQSLAYCTLLNMEPSSRDKTRIESSKGDFLKQAVFVLNILSLKSLEALKNYFKSPSVQSKVLREEMIKKQILCDIKHKNNTLEL